MHNTPFLLHRGLDMTSTSTGCVPQSRSASHVTHSTNFTFGCSLLRKPSRFGFRHTRQAAIMSQAESSSQVPAAHYSDEQLLRMPLEQLMCESRALRDSAYTCITFSPKVFIPLTRLCRDSCGYCTFALPPSPGRRVYMTLDEVLEVARLGQHQGCTEALFTLGKARNTSISRSLHSPTCIQLEAWFSMQPAGGIVMDSCDLLRILLISAFNPATALELFEL